jgi:hypothetical protein
MPIESNRSPPCQARPQGGRTALPRLALARLLFEDPSFLRGEPFSHHQANGTETSAPRSMDAIIQALDEALMVTSGSFSVAPTTLPTHHVHLSDELPPSRISTNATANAEAASTTSRTSSNTNDPTTPSL